MFLRLFLLFTIVPAVELYLLIRIGQLIGALPTVGLIVGTGMLGAALAKREGLHVLREVQADLQAGKVPARGLVEGLLVLIGAVLLITPGVLTDLTGFVLIAPPTRRLLARRLQHRFTGSIQVGSLRVGPVRPSPPSGDRGDPDRSPDQRHFKHPVR